MAKKNKPNSDTDLEKKGLIKKQIKPRYEISSSLRNR